MSTEKRRRNKVGIGVAADLPTITNVGVSVGDEYFATDTGAYFKCTWDNANNVKRWTSTNFGAGVQTGTDQLGNGNGTKVVTATVSTTSRIFVSRRDLPGGGTAIGLLGVTAPLVGVAGANFTAAAVAEANQAAVAADTSKFDWMVVG